jgi:hypothetical protein
MIGGGGQLISVSFFGRVGPTAGRVQPPTPGYYNPGHTITIINPFTRHGINLLSTLTRAMQFIHLTLSNHARILNEL